MNASHSRSLLPRAAWVCGALSAAMLAGCASEESSQPTARDRSRAERAAPAVAVRTPASPFAPTETPVPVPPVATPAAPPSADDVAAAWSEGTALYTSRAYSDASGKLQLAAAGRPEDAYAHYLLGLSLWKGGSPQRAEPALERAAELGGGSIKTWINLARVRLELDEPGSALEAAERALAIDSGSADALHQKGRALAELGRREPALETLRQAHAAAPDNGYIANTLGYHLIQTGCESEAISLLEAARDRLPGVAYVRNNLGVAYERTGRTAEAIAEYRAAVGAGDSGGKAVASLGRLRAPLEPALAQALDTGVVDVTSAATGIGHSSVAAGGRDGKGPTREP